MCEIVAESQAGSVASAASVLVPAGQCGRLAVHGFTHWELLLVSARPVRIVFYSFFWLVSQAAKQLLLVISVFSEIVTNILMNTL
jgi:hypothetical protein